MSSIILDRKHGVAPALTFCRICGKDTNEIALLGAKANKVMKDLYEATDGAHGSREGYKEYGHNRIPAQEPCDECMSYLKDRGCIIIARDTGEYLRLTKDIVDSLVGRVGNEERVIDFESMRGKVVTIPKAFWYSDGENIRLRDAKEWM